MDGTKDAILRIVEAAMKAKELDVNLTDAGYGNTPYFFIYGKLEEALLLLAGEEETNFEDTTVYTALTTPMLQNERRAAMISYTRQNNFSKDREVEQPKPNLISEDEMRKMYGQCGGYMYQRESSGGEMT